jgi:hypothetical protein
LLTRRIDRYVSVLSLSTRAVSSIVQRLTGTKRFNSSTQFRKTTMCADSVEESKPGAFLDHQEALTVGRDVVRATADAHAAKNLPFGRALSRSSGEYCDVPHQRLVRSSASPPSSSIGPANVHAQTRCADLATKSVYRPAGNPAVTRLSVISVPVQQVSHTH